MSETSKQSVALDIISNLAEGTQIVPANKKSNSSDISPGEIAEKADVNVSTVALLLNTARCIRTVNVNLRVAKAPDCPNCPYKEYVGRRVVICKKGQEIMKNLK